MAEVIKLVTKNNNHIKVHACTTCRYYMRPKHSWSDATCGVTTESVKFERAMAWRCGSEGKNWELITEYTPVGFIGWVKKLFGE